MHKKATETEKKPRGEARLCCYLISGQQSGGSLCPGQAAAAGAGRRQSCVTESPASGWGRAETQYLLILDKHHPAESLEFQFPFLRRCDRQPRRDFPTKPPLLLWGGALAAAPPPPPSPGYAAFVRCTMVRGRAGTQEGDGRASPAPVTPLTSPEKTSDRGTDNFLQPPAPWQPTGSSAGSCRAGPRHSSACNAASWMPGQRERLRIFPKCCRLLPWMPGGENASGCVSITTQIRRKTGTRMSHLQPFM